MYIGFNAGYRLVMWSLWIFILNIIELFCWQNNDNVSYKWQWKVYKFTCYKYEKLD